jgi:transposase InsO family protein
MCICSELGISRQGYYKGRKQSQSKKLQTEIMMQLVHFHRAKMPMLGGKKLYRLMKLDLDRLGSAIGRDKFFIFLSENDLLIHRKKRYVKTTNSSHRFKIHKNLTKGIKPVGVDEIYVSDITYIRVKDSFSYLALITDLYSRKIVGHDFSDSLNLEGSLRALKMSLKGKGKIKNLIHHSDRGLQYCSTPYTELLAAHEIRISMSEKGNPYENAVAERVNGILKGEFMLSETFKSKALANQAVQEAIDTYNEYRPHMSIDYMTPNQKYAA